MKKYILLLLSFLSLNAFGNSEISQYIPTPNSASLGAYGVVPVSMYTGKPEISIPLHTLKYKGFSLPVSLNYDGSGVKVNDMPGWVGSGWSLNAGGVITRPVRGTIDEKHSKQLYMYYETLAKYRKVENYDPNYFSNFEIEYGDYFGRYQKVSHARGFTFNDEAAIANGDLDRCSDIYFFNFLNYSGCFFLDGNKDWVVKSESNLEIIFDCKDRSNYLAPFIPKFYNGSDMYETIKGFTIRDENGYSYIFGGTTDAIEYTTPFFDMGQWDAMSWYLTRIEDKFGEVLYEFQYERGKFLVQVYDYVVQQEGNLRQPDQNLLDYTTSAIQGGVGLINDYRRLKPLNVTDKYKHAYMNCRAAQYGQGGEDITEIASNLREWNDKRTGKNTLDSSI